MRKIKFFFLRELPHWDFFVFIILLAVFFLKLCFWTTSIRPGVAPDELQHVYRSLLYSRYQGLMLEDSPQTYLFGLVSHQPYLYHFLLGKLSLFNFWNLPPILFLRFLNIAMGLITVTLSYQLFRLLSRDKLIMLTAVLVLTNIPMYSFLSAFVSYDNLAHLFSVLSFYNLFAFLKTRHHRYLVFLTMSLLAGSLTKVTLLALIFIFALILLFDYFYHRRKNIPFIVSSLQKRRWKKFFSAAVIGTLIFLNGHLYLVNLLKYKRITPVCSQVLSVQQCSQNDNFRRYHQLHETAKRIPRKMFLKPHDYFFYWRTILGRGIFGIFGHEVLFKNSQELLPYYALILLALFFLIRHHDPKETLMSYNLFIVLAYMGILFFFVNYATYLKTAYLEAGLQGRYVFPVIYPAVFLFSFYLLNRKSKAWKYILFAVVAFVFLYGDFPYLLRHIPPSWYLR